ncbi:helix-turn-helix domain-containing protein [Yinghuangia soli]|uniref:Helix-turn-helix domain-containing protein n=1 Tax=Yinghuangia soli TaxID=2908204 RepID=A0AA41U4Y7_9ACTN|nr:helix-turn-helix domain-containing protein [Yinghuangia soli]MCF2531317.1 helix-turn-helix domain-containing protein [Yinghuangia soli]
MANERLRNAVADKGIKISDLAGHLGVDPKTVERWITKERVPHRAHREGAARYLGADEIYLWPSVEDDPHTKRASQAELVTMYPNRSAVPAKLWSTLLGRSRESIDLLAFAGLFLADTRADLADVLAEKGRSGTRVRILLGDPDSPAVRARGDEEGIGDGLAARVRLALNYLRPALAQPGVDVRLHGVVLYNSIYRFDRDALVNTHVYGAPAAQNPVLHLRQVSGGRVYTHYMASFDRVWESARPVAEVS